jgi:hypothetical protein
MEWVRDAQHIDEFAADAVELRDSKDHGTGPTLGFTKAELIAFLDGAKKGEFDHLAV